jgi:hypothetical protein
MLLVAGCGPAAYFPLRPSKPMTYKVRTGFSTYIERPRAVRTVSISGGKGYEIVSRLGTSRLAWVNGILTTDRLANLFFMPPLPLLDPQIEKGSVSPWNGTIIFPGGTEEATGTIQQQTSKSAIGDRKLSTIKVSIQIDSPKRQIEIESEYARGLGLVRQEQRTNGVFDLEMEAVSP